MIRSMTGFSEGRFEEESFRLSLSLRSTNHRYFDLQIRLPRSLAKFEGRIRKILKEGCVRGHIEVGVSLEQIRETQLRVDRDLFDSYLKVCLELRKEFKLSQEPDLAKLIQSPGVIGSANGEIDASQWDRIAEALEGLTGQALTDLNEMRETEGAALGKDMRGRLERIRELNRQVESLSAEVPTRAHRKIESRIRKVLTQLEIEPQRLAQEAALLASQSDICEEVARLTSHLDQAATLLASKRETGKKLDFLLQEMNREANTILSKTGGSADDGLEITRLAVEIKSEIEKVREQAQNIE